MLQTGTIVAGYRIDGVLGEGGMGVVYRATQLSLNRVVALKLLAGELSDDAGFRARFQREAQLQAALDNDHIVSVYEAGQTEHGLFMAMRLIDGPTLKDLILRHELDPRRSVRLLSQVAQALDAAHAAGLIHRDIKPQNILIGRGDHTYLADFGLIKAPDDAERLTGTGQFIGTIDYVSPEQIQGNPASAASDTYALTGVLYECLTAQVPFARANEPATLHAHITAPPPKVTEQRPDLPATLDEVVAAGLAKDPAARPASATELIRLASRAFSAGTPVATPSQPTRLAPAGVPQRSQSTQVPRSGGAVAASPALAAAPAALTRPAGQAAVTSPAPVTDGEMPSAAPDTAPAPTTAPARRRAGRGWVIAVAGALALVAIAAGFLVGHSGSSSGSTSGTASFTNLATVGHVQLRYPADLQLTSAGPAIPGLSFGEPIGLLRGASVGGLTAGMVDTGGPTLLPAAFRRHVEGGLPAAAPVTLNGLQADRYAHLRVSGLSGEVTVYAVPSTAGVATVACWSASAAAVTTFGPECDRVANTLRLVGASAYPLGVSATYARGLSSAFDHLGAATRGPLAALGAAGTPSAQASASQRLASAYNGAADQVSALTGPPMVRYAQAAIVSSLRQIAAGYSHAAAAARSGSGAGYTHAGGEVSAGSAALNRALQSLNSLGYAVGRK